MFLSGMVGTASSGTEKKYKITDSTDSYPYSAYAGEIVEQNNGMSVKIRTASGFPIYTQDVDESYFQGVSSLVADPNMVRCFVMPAEDVIVTR